MKINCNAQVVKKCARYGKLSSETYTALRHTSLTLIQCASHLLNELEFEYVLLSKFQTDPLEKRFGLYRRMSGCNYNVSISQVMESEKKLKILNALKIKKTDSTTSSLFLKSLSPEIQKVSPITLEGSKFMDICDDISEDTFNNDNASALIYVSGYVSFAVSKKVSCGYCVSRLSASKLLDIEFDENASAYINIIDRGGLKWPTDFVYSICVNTFMIFEQIISKLENEFLQHFNQKGVLMSCSYAYNTEFHYDEVCSCSISTHQLIRLIISVISNILLNNYCKINNNYLADKSKDKAKLSTLI